jgi:hypothetical protein
MRAGRRPRDPYCPAAAARGRNLGRDLVAAPYQEQQRRQRRAGHSLGGLRELLADVVVADRRVCAYAHGRHRRAPRRLSDSSDAGVFSAPAATHAFRAERKRRALRCRVSSHELTRTQTCAQLFDRWSRGRPVVEQHRMPPSVQPPFRGEQAAIRSSSTARSRVLWVSEAARSNSARASSSRPSFASRSPRTAGSRW